MRGYRWLVPLLLVLWFASPAKAVPPGWAPGGDMAVARDEHTATLLPDGSVLVAGGFTNGASPVPTRSAERYFPATNTWKPAGNMVFARTHHVAALLPDGRVLVAGGYDANRVPLQTAETYDPVRNLWQQTGPMATARSDATATPLPDGTVLIAGGWTEANSTSATNSTEIFNPVSNGFTEGKPMGRARAMHAATRVGSGVLVTGGYQSPSSATSATELYAAGTWTPRKDMGALRAVHEATLLADGRVLVSGGRTGSSTHLATAEVYSPANDTWTPTAPMAAAHDVHAASLLPSGRVLVTGGDNAAGAQQQGSELYDPATNAWTFAGNMVWARHAHSSTLLRNGRVLIVGGYGSNRPPATRYASQAELWTEPTTMLADPAVSFDDLVPGTAGAGVAHLRNTGDAPLLPSNVALSGSFAGDYAITSDGCSGAVIPPNGGCDIGLRFVPGAVGARSATLTFDANTPAVNHAISLIGRGVAPPSPAPPTIVQPNVSPTLQKIVVTLSYNYGGVTKKSTRLANLVVKGVPAGSTVRVSCRKGCLRKSLVRRNVRGNVKLKGFVTAKRRVKAGTKIVVTVSHPNMISAIKTLTVRKGKKPQITTRCQRPGETKTVAC